MDTIFTKIINREIPAYIVYEDDLVIAFLDITQATKGHTLVVTKAPYKNLYEVPSNVLSHLIQVVQNIAKAIQKSLSPIGLNLLNNNEPVAGQTVFHYHMHIIPRYNAEEITFKLANHMDSLDGDTYKKRADLIKAAL